MVEGGGFEPPKAEPADLQSDPFGRSGTPPISGKLNIISDKIYYVNSTLLLFIKKHKFNYIRYLSNS